MTPLARESLRLLRLLAAELGLDAVGQRPWASALFTGTRLTIAVKGNDDAWLDEWLIALPELDLPLPGYFVADAEVIERSANAATIELLLIEA